MNPRLAVLTVLLLIFTGCTTVPVAGPVESVPVSAPPRGIELAPEPPQEGVTPSRLIDGFLQAMADPEADYEVARQYLASEVRDAWEPRTGARVYDGLVTETDGTFALVGTLIGTLDDHGRFASAREELNFPLQLVQEEGEWRIGRAPSGVLLSRFIFERYYAHVTTYFMSSSGSYVVPDVLHVPEAMLTPSRIVEAQIAGPSPAIAPAVRNAIPAGTELGPDGASVDPSGTARVSLSNLPELSEDRRRELGAQLVWSLTAIPRVSGLEILDGSVPLALPGQDVEGVLELASQQGYQVLSRATTPDLFGVRRGVAGRVSPTGSFVPMQSSGAAVSEVAVSLDAALVAFIDESRRLLLVGPLGGQLTPVVPEFVNLRSAQFVQGQVWVLGDDPAGLTQLLRIDSQGRITVLDTSGLGAPVVDFAASQAGARVALITGDGEARSFGMAVVTGGPSPAIGQYTPVMLADESNSPLRAFVDLAWSGETELALIAVAQVESPSVYLAKLDGSLVEHLGPVGEVAVEITALPRLGGDAVAIRSDADVVRRYEVRTRWSGIDIELTEVSYPG